MTQPKQYRVTVIGCGKMGSAMIHAWQDANLLKRLEIIDPGSVNESLLSAKDTFHVKLLTQSRLQETDIVILAVKPQIMGDICTALKGHLPNHVPILSIAAGKNIAYFERTFSQTTPIIRIMPNLPATIGKGMSALVANKVTTKAQKAMAQSLLSANGETLWVSDENKMDAVTALSGSGPAYLFYFIEALTQAGVSIGLTNEESTLLAKQTIIGAAALVESSTETPAVLRQNVTSKAGTTESALQVLMDGRFQDILNEALLTAKSRSQELAN